MGIDLSGYVEVKDRIALFKEKYPNGSLQSELVPAPEGFIAVKAYAYRGPDDKLPGTGLAWEPFPGKTPYTKDSELQNAETSAWGRALIAALVADASQGVASANEVRNRQSSPSPTGGGTGSPVAGRGSSYQCPACGSHVSDNREAHFTESRKPAWKCPNRECTGGKNGYSWASWNPEEFDGGEVIREDYPAADPETGEILWPEGEEPF